MDMDTGTGKRSSYRLLLVEDDSVIAGGDEAPSGEMGL